MRHYFPLSNSQNKLLAQVADTIKEYYPIDVDIQSSEYNDYAGTKKIDALVSENMTNNKAFGQPWKSFLTELKQSTKKRVHNSSHAHEISFSGKVVLETYQDNSMRRIKKIQFAVSLIGPYYSICGIDETLIKDKMDDREFGYPAINVITISPYEEFEKEFTSLESQIKAQFPDHKFLPIDICLSFVKGLHLSYNQEACTVYNALFNNSLDQFTSNFFRGDVHYGYDKGN